MTYQTLDLQTARFVLEQIGSLIGAGAQILQQRLDDLEASAQRARDIASQMANEASEIQDQIDQLEGNDTGIEDRRHAQKLADLKAEAEANGTAGTAAYNNLVQLEDKLHTLKLDNIRKEQAANSGGAGSGASSNASGGASAGFALRPGAGGATTNINVQPPNIFLLTGDDASRRQLADALVRDIDNGLRRLNNLRA